MKIVNMLKKTADIILIFDKTPLREAGGQVRSEIFTHEKIKLENNRYKKIDEIFSCYVKNNTKELKVNKKYMLSVTERREKIRNNHHLRTFTCFFKKCFGDHISQKGH